jgi:DNA-binding response OmpR family regulator
MNLSLPDVTTADVLVIDDNRPVRDALELLLAGAGYRVAVAPDGREGLRRFDAGRFRAVVIDVDIPGIDGWDVAQAVRRAAPEAGVVLMSARFETSDSRAGQPGVLRLPKPFALDELIEMIERVSAPREESQHESAQAAAW